jgi:hypothetical protein
MRESRPFEDALGQSSEGRVPFVGPVDIPFENLRRQVPHSALHERIRVPLLRAHVNPSVAWGHHDARRSTNDNDRLLRKRPSVREPK